MEEINALGGIQFEIKWEDDEHDPEKSVNAYNNLKDWGMQMLVGYHHIPLPAWRFLLKPMRIICSS